MPSKHGGKFEYTIQLLLSDLIKASTAAELLGIKQETVRQLADRHKLASVIIDGQRYLLRSDVQRYGTQRKQANVRKRRALGHPDYRPLIERAS